MTDEENYRKILENMTEQEALSYVSSILKETISDTQAIRAACEALVGGQFHKALGYEKDIRFPDPDPWF
ncbi:MAG TPA: hypothetical protein DDX98_06390 [Bacteroidales bacterium]|jgi:hypothetical protein|nr:hypothetical protein [Bacteroidales bacterium]